METRHPYGGRGQAGTEAFPVFPLLLRGCSILNLMDSLIGDVSLRLIGVDGVIGDISVKLLGADGLSGGRCFS